MTGLMIGELARQAGVATSALRYYEKAGLLPLPARASNRRQYDQGVLGSDTDHSSGSRCWLFDQRDAHVLERLPHWY
jgi:hypothetical protein